ncbi:MAG: Deoxyguanosinetriphosphate triphosphohydrolase-like protein [Alphaproteobacteria bacterium]|nr:Deoxyguanosinetriphosphate triphosphohydrolase-like protein [Alphaproteobacteria bacterium]
MEPTPEAVAPSIWSEARRSLKRDGNGDDHRIPQQHDYDRLLFSTPVRRLADKTQVFPLDPSDAVRTRLTHSHEVANLARSMGNRLLGSGSTLQDADKPGRVAHILATIGLAHDLGNPPFGHQGETAIGHWFHQHMHVFADAAGDVPERLYPEFTAFEGNAQTLRILTRLQVSAGNVGLDLTAGTLSALMKYTVSCDQRAPSSAATKKYGYFEAEHDVVKWVREHTGIAPGERHPLTWIMEAADDIAYSILDIEDAIKKGIISPDDVLSIISGHLDTSYDALKGSIQADFEKISRDHRSIGEIREIKSSYVRTNLIRNLIGYAVREFEENWGAIEARTHSVPLLQKCGLCKLLKDTAFQYVFSSTPVRRVEAEGAIAIEGLMTFFWDAIRSREDAGDLKSGRESAAAAYGWSLISDNYRQVAIREHYQDRDGTALPMRYRELRLLTDMISGMTDGFARSLYKDLASAGHIRG